MLTRFAAHPTRRNWPALKRPRQHRTAPNEARDKADTENQTLRQEIRSLAATLMSWSENERSQESGLTESHSVSRVLISVPWFTYQL